MTQQSPNRIPFNWEYFQKNRPRVETRDGRGVEDISFSITFVYGIVLIGGNRYAWWSDGKYSAADEHNLDLYMVVEPDPFKIEIKDGQIASITQGEHWFAARLPIEDGTYILRKI